MLADQHMWCREENFIAFMCAQRSIWTRKLPRPNHAHVYFIFPWPALYVALFCLIHRWSVLEKVTKTLSFPILVAIKVVFVDNVWECETRKAGSCKAQILETRESAWILLRSEVNYLKNKCGEPTILFYYSYRLLLWWQVMAPRDYVLVHWWSS